VRSTELAAIVLAVAACSAPARPPVDRPEIDKPVEAPATPVEWTALVGSIKAIEVDAAGLTLAPRVQELLAAELGKPIDRRRLRGELAEVLGLAGVADVTASAKQLDDGIALMIELVPQPALHALVAREVGGGAIPLPGQLAAATGLPVDLGLVAALADELRTQYLDKGFTAVVVTWKQVPAGAGQADITVEVTPGAASKISAVEFKGNSHAKKAELAKAIGDTVAAGAAWNTDKVDRATLVITAYYYDHGFVNVAVTAPKPPGATAPLVFTIVEGDQFRLGKVEVTKVSADDAKKYLKLAGLKKGDVFSRTAVSTGITKIQDASKQVVTPITKVDTKKKTIDLALELSKP
jgi:outer membrane protein assembly factor BamA